MVDYFDSKRRLLIAQEIKTWSRDVLQKPSEFFNGLPPCPYAFDAWVNNRVKIDFGNELKVVWHANNFEEEVDLVIVVVEQWSHDKIESFCDEWMDGHPGADIVLMPFVPDSGEGTGQPEEEMIDWEPLVDEEYAMVFIQRLSDVNAASENLEEAGYYKNCSAEFLEYVKSRRDKEFGNAGQEPFDGQEDRQEDEEAALQRQGSQQGDGPVRQDAGGEEEGKA